MDKESENKIIDSWYRNAEPWIRAVREGEIESRVLVTNKAILDAVVDLHPSTVLDVGCGEGWLVRELQSEGIDVLGVDAVPALIESAEKAGKGRFRILTYEELSFTTIGEKFDVLVCNFSLFGKESVFSVFRAASDLLNHQGALVVQTLHPTHSIGDEQTQEGWKEGSWEGFSNVFQDPAPWYFRAIDSWKTLFCQNGFDISTLIEPVNPKTGLPASIIYIGIKNA